MVTRKHIKCVSIVCLIANLILTIIASSRRPSAAMCAITAVSTYEINHCLDRIELDKLANLRAICDSNSNQIPLSLR